MVERLLVVLAGVFHARLNLDGTGSALTLGRSDLEGQSIGITTLKIWLGRIVCVANRLRVRGDPGPIWMWTTPVPVSMSDETPFP